MRVVKHVVLFMVLSPLLAIGQSKENSPLKFNVIPPAPEAASIGKYVDMPVSAYTGLPKIEVPVYELKSYELSLPINLSYHASGLKWDEIPSWVGAGWSLNAGGLVSRTIRGRNDEDPGYGFFSQLTSGFNVTGFFNADGTINSSANSNFGSVSPYGACPPSPNDQYLSVLYASKGGLDLEPDLFFFSLPDGQSGKFVYSRTKQLKLIPNQYANITYANDALGKPFLKWTIVGKNGTKYFFDNSETTLNNSSCGELYNGTPETFTIPDINAPSTWKLTKMESANGLDYINFEYDAESLLYQNATSVTTYDRVSGTVSPPGSSTCINNTTISGLRLKRIYTKSGYEVRFIANTGRPGMSGGKMLDEIQIYYKTDIIKKSVLSYSMANGLPSLLAVQDSFGVGSAPVPPYDFSYYQDGLNGSNYNRDSYGVDHWGYNNSAPASQNYIKSPALIYQNWFFNGANREPDLASCRWMTLKEVRYPTGGRSTFDYELHDYSNVPTFSNFIYSPGLVPIESVEFAIANNTAISYSQTKNFTLSAATDVVVLYELPAIPGGGIPVTGCNASISKPSFATINYLSGNSQISSAPIQNLGAGTYTLSAEFTPSQFGWGTTDLSTLKFYVKVYRVQTLQERIQNNALKGGGLRVKKITNYGDQVLSKTYEYVNRGTGISSGKLASFPMYAYTAGFNDGQMFGTPCYITAAGTMLVRANASSVPLGVNQGSHVGYDVVTEYHGDATTNNGFTVYNFTNTPDVVVAAYPFVPNQSYSYKNGLLLKQEDYTSTSRLVGRTTNTYTVLTDPGPIVQGLKIVQAVNNGCTGCNNRTFTYGAYSEATEKVWLASTTSETYDSKEDSYFTGNSIFTYDPETDMVLIKEEQISNGGAKKKYTRYNYHPSIKNAVIQEYAYYSTSNAAPFYYIGGVNKNYNNTYLKPDQIDLMETLQTSYTTNVPSPSLFKQRLLFNAFDSQGNVLSYKKDSDATTTYIVWDSNRLFPIAQAINPTTLVQVAHTSFENLSGEGNLNFILNPVATDKKAGNLSHDLTNNSISYAGLAANAKYVVSYWAKGTAPTINNVTANNDALVADSDGWRYYEKVVNSDSAFTLTISGTALIDELRLYPQGAQMTTYTYDPKIGMTSSSDVNSVISYYFYDNRNRLEYLRDFEKNLLKRNEYSYQRDNN